MTPQSETSGRPRRVLLALNLARKGARDRFSGFLRYNLRTNWEIEVLAFGNRTATPAVVAKQLRILRPDAIVYTDGAAPLLAAALRDARLRRRPFCINFEHQINLAALRPHGVIRLDDAAVVREAVETLAGAASPISGSSARISPAPTRTSPPASRPSARPPRRGAEPAPSAWPRPRRAPRTSAKSPAGSRRFPSPAA